MTRCLQLDLVRVVALGLVLLCHFMQNTFDYFRIGSIAGGIGNSLFFILSGFLCGRIWRSQGSTSLGGRWLLHRIVRLYQPLLIFLVVYLITALVTGMDLSCRNVVLNFLLLNWFGRLPYAGHLWFITGIVVLYGVLMIASACTGVKRILLMVCLAAAQIVLVCLGIRQAYLLSLVIPALIAFWWGDCLLGYVKRFLGRRWSWGFLVGLGIVLVSLVGYRVIGDLVSGYYWLTGLVAIMIVFCCLQLEVHGGGLNWLSTCTYETYLVHYPIAVLALPHIPASWWYVAILPYATVSIALGYMIRRIEKL